MNPTGHSAVYLNHVCAASPTELRLCQAGESGVVISRYHKISGLDWVAIPLIPYLYAVEDVGQVPQSVDQAQVRRAARCLSQEASAGPGDGWQEWKHAKGGVDGVGGRVLRPHHPWL